LLFSDHNIQTTNARKPTKSSEEADVRLVFILKKKQEVAP